MLVLLLLITLACSILTQTSTKKLINSVNFVKQLHTYILTSYGKERLPCPAHASNATIEVINKYRVATNLPFGIPYLASIFGLSFYLDTNRKSYHVQGNDKNGSFNRFVIRPCLFDSAEGLPTEDGHKRLDKILHNIYKRADKLAHESHYKNNNTLGPEEVVKGILDTGINMYGCLRGPTLTCSHFTTSLTMPNSDSDPGIRWNLDLPAVSTGQYVLDIRMHWLDFLPVSVEPDDLARNEKKDDRYNEGGRTSVCLSGQGCHPYLVAQELLEKYSYTSTFVKSGRRTVYFLDTNGRKRSINNYESMIQLQALIRKKVKRLVNSWHNATTDTSNLHSFDILFMPDPFMESLEPGADINSAADVNVTDLVIHLTRCRNAPVAPHSGLKKFKLPCIALASAKECDELMEQVSNPHRNEWMKSGCLSYGDGFWKYSRVFNILDAKDDLAVPWDRDRHGTRNEVPDTAQGLLINATQLATFDLASAADRGDQRTQANETGKIRPLCASGEASDGAWRRQLRCDFRRSPNWLRAYNSVGGNVGSHCRHSHAGYLLGQRDSRFKSDFDFRGRPRGYIWASRYDLCVQPTYNQNLLLDDPFEQSGKEVGLDSCSVVHSLVSYDPITAASNATTSTPAEGMQRKSKKSLVFVPNVAQTTMAVRGVGFIAGFGDSLGDEQGNNIIEALDINTASAPVIGATLVDASVAKQAVDIAISQIKAIETPNQSFVTREVRSGLFGSKDGRYWKCRGSPADKKQRLSAINTNHPWLNSLANTSAGLPAGFVKARAGGMSTKELLREIEFFDAPIARCIMSEAEMVSQATINTTVIRLEPLDRVGMNLTANPTLLSFPVKKVVLATNFYAQHNVWILSLPECYTFLRAHKLLHFLLAKYLRVKWGLEYQRIFYSATFLHGFRNAAINPNRQRAFNELGRRSLSNQNVHLEYMHPVDRALSTEKDGEWEYLDAYGISISRPDQSVDGLHNLGGTSQAVTDTMLNMIAAKGC